MQRKGLVTWVGLAPAVGAIALTFTLARADAGAGRTTATADLVQQQSWTTEATSDAQLQTPSIAGDPTTTGDQAPPAVQVPAGNTRIQTLHVLDGVLVYTCQQGNWILSDPEATMGKTKSRPTVLYTAGPKWISATDGSWVVGQPIASAARAGTVPALLVRGVKHRGPGWLSRVTYIQRLVTTGGLPPAGSCTDGAVAASRYTAKETFWVATDTMSNTTTATDPSAVTPTDPATVTPQALSGTHS